jgi:hypothetical protein
MIFECFGSTPDARNNAAVSRIFSRNSRGFW